MPSAVRLDPEAAAFYTAQSVFSDPGALVARYADLPADPTRLAHIARGLVIHRLEGDHLDHAIPTERLHHDAETRYVDDILRIIVERDDAPLDRERPYSDRFVGICRDFALLFCSFLRHVGIPARLRSGFADYFADDGFHADHVVTEYWDGARGWLLADPNVVASPPDGVDPLDVPRDRFVVAGAAWRAIREGRADPAAFGLRLPDLSLVGEWFVCGNVRLDLAALNRAETLLWDIWGEGADDDASMTDEIRVLYDRVAELTHDAVPFAAARELYTTHDGLRTPRTVLSRAPYNGPSLVTLR
ncbi:transglutaminase-like domain-containing protein [Streptomyces profundus]|uniref:transglutaminase-like domain-containing protein n=1 Tax=Streptomyces profundus TaxID=2867410 RepID=UPI001D16750C|nr:transglutaminase domain-containing protein [Streptomyces sp. MA3_2.13]UED83763.1 transglutaminase domain-containing protein [Streptomyces sp. MA3_2.13]